MSTATHTPGPWTVCKIAEGFRQIIGVTTDGGKNGFLIAIEPASEQDMADAHLIAAAPDLLAALKGIAQFAQMQVEDLAAEAQEGGVLARVELREWSAVLSAIAKAEGAVTQDKRGT